MEFLIEDGYERKHKKKLTSLISSSKTSIDIATAYLTETDLLKGKSNANVRILTSVSASDILSGSVSLDAISSLFKQGNEVRLLDPQNQKFHPKVYIFDRSSVVISSANFTRNAMENNIEVGVSCDSSQISELLEWYDSLWNKAIPLTKDLLIKLIDFQNKHQQTVQKIKTVEQLYNQLEIKYSPLNHKYATSSFFICNSNRKYSDKNNIGGYIDEELMLTSGYVLAWEDFRYIDHMKKVKAGDIIFLYAKKKGVIAIGEALEGVTRFTPDKALKVAASTNEWGIPVDWLTPRDEQVVLKISANEVPRPTFLDISDEHYKSLRNKVEPVTDSV